MRFVTALIVLTLTPAAFAQNPYPGNAAPASPWLLDGTAGSIVSLGGGNNGLQLVDGGGSSVYSQYYAVSTLQDLTLESRFRLDATTGGPNLFQLSMPSGGGNEVSIALGVDSNLPGFVGQPRFVLRSILTVNSGGGFYADLGPIDANLHTVQLYIDRTSENPLATSGQSDVKASFDGALVYNNTLATFKDTNFGGEGYVEFGAGIFNRATGTTTATFDYVQYSAGDSVVPEPGTAAVLALLAGASLVGRRPRH
jgi:hypothetical protein